MTNTPTKEGAVLGSTCCATQAWSDRRRMRSQADGRLCRRTRMPQSIDRTRLASRSPAQNNSSGDEIMWTDDNTIGSRHFTNQKLSIAD
jgi:hypothetical protein